MCYEYAQVSEIVNLIIVFVSSNQWLSLHQYFSNCINCHDHDLSLNLRIVIVSLVNYNNSKNFTSIAQ